LQNYVCVYCLIDFKDFSGKDPNVVIDWLYTGCAHELHVECDEECIDWYSPMILPKEYFEYFERIENESTKTS
jgi:hypothetical protein